MELRTFAICVTAIAGLGQVVLLSLQYRALRRTGHYSLRLLCGSTVCGIGAFVASLAPDVISLSDAALWRMYIVTGALTAVQIVLGVWGVAALFRSYIGLTESALAGDRA